MGPSLKARIRGWFKENPASELTQQQLLEKFGCNVHSLRYHLGCMKDEGLIVRVARPVAFKAAQQEGV